MAESRLCKIDGCNKPHRARGWCNAHWERWNRHGDPLLGRTPEGDPKRFLAALCSDPPDECVIWPFSTKPCGYGELRHLGRSRLAHRVSWELFHGRTMPEDMDAAHSPLVCHNRACVNPLHIREATRSENQRDRDLDGTHNRGERQHCSKLTADKVRLIRSDKRKTFVIARDYAVSWSAIDDIRRGRTWAWLD